MKKIIVEKKMNFWIFNIKLHNRITMSYQPTEFEIENDINEILDEIDNVFLEEENDIINELFDLCLDDPCYTANDHENHKNILPK